MKAKIEMKTRKMKVLLEFDAPCGVEFSEIRDFITDELESGGGSRHPDDPLFYSLGNVHVSKPITAWRDPSKKKKPAAKIINIKQEA